MATINKTILSDRRLAVRPSVMSYTPRATAQHARDIEALGQQASHTIDHALRTINFVKERDAQIMCEKWNAGVLRLLNGSVVKNEDGSETRVPGAAQKTWSDYEKQGTDKSPITDLADFERDFQNSPEFRAMDSLTRHKFDRMMEVPRARAMSEANRLYDRNAEARDKFYDALGDANDDERLKLAMYGSDEDFDAALREVATSKTDRKFRKLDRSNPQVEAAYQKALLDETKNAAIGRVAALAADGAAGEAKIVGGEMKSNIGNIERAEHYLDALSSSGRIRPEESRALGYKILQARSQLAKRMQGEIETAADETILKLGEKGGVENADGVIFGLRAMANAKRTGTDQAIVGKEVSNAALAAAQKIDHAADLETVRIVKNDILSGRTLTMSDGKTSIYEPGSRRAKAYTVAVAEAEKDRAKSAAALDDDIRYQELELDYAIESGMASKEEIANRKREIVDRVYALSAGRLMKPEDVAEFRKRWTNRNASDESAAAIEFDRAFGLSLEDFTDAKGEISKEITDAGYKKVLRSGQKALFPGTDKNVSLGEYLKMRASFLDRLRALPANADRRQETAKLLDEFKGGWYARQTEANIEALSRTMNDIHIGIDSEVEAERLKAAAEEEKRNMPVVDRRHPANADPNPDPLEFYRQANPLDPTLNFR